MELLLSRAWTTGSAYETPRALTQAPTSATPAASQSRIEPWSGGWGGYQARHSGGLARSLTYNPPARVLSLGRTPTTTFSFLARENPKNINNAGNSNSRVFSRVTTGATTGAPISIENIFSRASSSGMSSLVVAVPTPGCGGAKASGASLFGGLGITTSMSPAGAAANCFWCSTGADKSVLQSG